MTEYLTAWFKTVLSVLVAIFTRMNVQFWAFRAQAVESIAAVRNSISNRTPDTRPIKIHTTNYQLIPLLPFESGHLPRKRKKNLIEVLLPDMPLALAVDYIAPKPKPIESCLSCQQLWLHQPRILPLASVTQGVKFLLRKICFQMSMNPNQSLSYHLLLGWIWIWLTYLTTSSWLWALSHSSSNAYSDSSLKAFLTKNSFLPLLMLTENSGRAWVHY